MYFKIRIMKYVRNFTYVLCLFIPILAHAVTTEAGKEHYQEYNNIVALNKQFKATMDEITKKQNAGQAVDWDSIAASLGMPSGLSRAEINTRLSQMQSLTADLMQNIEQSARSAGLTVDALILDNTSDDFDKTGKLVYDKLNNTIDTIRKLPPAQIRKDVSDGSSSVDVGNFLDQIRKQIPQLIRFVVALSYVCGICLMIAGVMKLKAYGQQTVMSSSHASFAGPLVYMTIGTALTFFPTMLNMATDTFMGPGGGDAVYSYTSSSSGFGFAGLTSAIVGIVKLVGFIAFFKGWMILIKMGSNNGQGVLGKGIVHIVAGILAVNIMATWEILRASFGYMW